MSSMIAGLDWSDAEAIYAEWHDLVEHLEDMDDYHSVSLEQFTVRHGLDTVGGVASRAYNAWIKHQEAEEECSDSCPHDDKPAIYDINEIKNHADPKVREAYTQYSKSMTEIGENIERLKDTICKDCGRGDGYCNGDVWHTS